jgi:hypothetical protein
MTAGDAFGSLTWAIDPHHCCRDSYILMPVNHGKCVGVDNKKGAWWRL